MERYGPVKTTVADIAREAGVGVGTVYLEFTSKDALLEALASGHHGELLGRMERAVSSSGSSASERLRALLDARVEGLLEHAARGGHAPDLVRCACRAVETSWERFAAAELRLVVGLLEAGIASGELRAVEASSVAPILLRAYASFTPPRLFEGCPRRARAELDAMHELVLQGLLAR